MMRIAPDLGEIEDMFNRYTVFRVSLVLAVLFLFAGLIRPQALIAAVIFGFLGFVGLLDLMQTHHSLRRNYPILAHIRWFAELVRPEIRQYLVEGDEEAAPFTRNQRSLVYERAKNLSAERAFGAQLNVYGEGYEFIAHSLRPSELCDPQDFRLKVGGAQCARPYSASVFNISAMSFGALSANAIRALNSGAKMGGFYHDTGEGSISPYHREFGGDIVWEVASGYFGCRTQEGRFDPARFADQAAHDQVRMIEIKLSQGAKPGHGGVLPAAKVTPEIAATRGVPLGRDCVSPPKHSAFSSPLELMEFIARLRELSGGKPVGFKLCIGQPTEFAAVVKAMLQTGIRPDFIVIDGAEGGTGAAPAEFLDHVGMPMRDGLLFARNMLVGAGLKDEIRLAAAGKVISAFDIASLMAIGADWTNSARGFMFALGCVQSLHCNTNQCPTGVATQDLQRQKALVVSDKATRVRNFHANTLKALAEMLAAAGLDHPGDLRPHHLALRVAGGEIRTFAQNHFLASPGMLLSGDINSPFYARVWARAQADSFASHG